MKSYRLVTSEEIIGNILESDGHEITFDKPAAIVLRATEGNNFEVVLVPIMTYADGPVKIKTQFILGECEIDSAMESEYKRIYHPSALEVPTTKLVTP